ncbi:phage tail tape measure protein [Lachnospiraceae bacterium 48-42]
MIIISEFIAKIRGELDTKEVEKKLDSLTKEKHQIKIDVDDSKIDEAAKKAQKINEKPVKVDTKVTGGKEVENLSQNFKQAEKSASGFGNTLKGLATATIANEIFRQIEQGAKQAVVAVQEIDKAIVDLQAATGDSYANIKQLMGGYNDFAKQLGATTTEVAAGASDWLRQGKSISDTNQLIQDSMVLSKVANLSSEDSTSYLTAMMKGYKKTADEVSEINDSLTSIDLAAAVDAGGLAEATSRVAASADLAGVSLNRLLGYEAAVGEASQESMSVIGNSFKTIFSRMSDIKAGKLELVDEDGTTETLSDVETVLNNIGIQLRDSANEFRGYDKVLDDTAEKWDNLSSVQQAAVSKAFAGQRQANRFKLLMENYNTALQYEKIANESSGTAMQKFNDGYLNSIEAKQKSLQASFEGLSTNLISRDTINGILEATQALVEFLDKTNLLKGALAGIATGGILKGFVALTSSITQAAMKMQNFHQAMSLLKAGNIGDNGIQKMSVLVDGLSSSQLNAIISSKHLSKQLELMNDKQQMSLLNTLGMSEAQATATLSTMGLVKAQGTATAGTLSLGSAFKGLFSTLLSNPIALITTGLSVGVTAWNIYNQSVQESIQRATEATTAWNESNSTLQEQINKYKELKSQLDSGTLTPTEEYETRQQILDIQMQISDQYGDQAANIDLVNGSLQTQLSLLQQISSENAKQALNENREEYKNAEEQMTTERSYLLGSIEIADKGKLNKEIQDIVSSFEESGLSLTKFGGGEKYFNILFKGDATQAEESINDFMNKIAELKDKYTDEDSINLLDSILDQAGKSYSENKDEVLGKNEESYKKFLQMDMLQKGTGKGSVADVFNQYTEAVEKYNEALSSGDQNTINKARSDFSAISEDVDALLSKSENSKFSTLFDDITDQLNTVGIKSMEFQEALSGNANTKNQFHSLSDGIKDASDGLKFLKLDAVDAMKAIVTAGEQTGESELWTLAEAWGITAESSREEIQEFIDVLSQAGLVSSEVGTSAESASKSFESFSTSVQKTVSDYATLKSIMSESVSGAGISSDNVDAFRAMFGADADKALEETANGYHLNRKALGELQAQMGEMTKTDYLSALSDQYTELQNIEAQISTFELLGQDTSGLEASRNGILDNISSLHELQNQYESATSAYQQWQSSMSGGEEGDMYDSIYGNLDDVKALYDKGLTGTNKFREFTDLMSNEDLSNASNEEIVAAYEKALPKIKRYFTEGQDGAQNFLEDVQNLNSEWAHMNEDGSWDIDFDDQKVADKLGIDVEAVQAIMKKLSDYGFDINLENPTASMKKLKSEAESAEKTLGELGDNVKVDLNADSFEEVDTQISSIKEYIDGIEGSDLELDVKTDKLNAANTILEYLISRKKQLGEKEGVDVEINIDESQLQAGYTILGRLRDNLQNLHGEVDVDTVNVQTAINTCVEQIEAMSPEMKVALGIQGMTTDEIKSGLLDGSIQLPVTADTEKANSDIEKIKGNKIDDKNFSVNANTSQAENSLSTIRNYLSAITSKEVTVTVNKVTKNESTHSTGKGGSPAGSQLVNGTAHAHGTAFANGSWGNPSPGKKLVGELGTEIVVNPHTGRWFTVGDNGAEFAEIPKNAIVFNHLQSESLLKKGYADGRGQSLATGTALASGTALSGGSGKFNAGGSGSSANSNTPNTTKPNFNNNDNSKSKDKSKKETKQTFDWIERKLERLQQVIDYTKAKFENLFTIKKKNSNLTKQIDQTNNLLKASQKAEKAYAKKASEVTIYKDKNGKRDKKKDTAIKKKIQSGAYNIKDYDEKTAEKINKYKEYYDKRYNAKKQVQELKTQKRELKEQKYQLRVDNSNNRIEMYDAKASLTTDYKKNNRYADKQIAHTKSSYDYQIKIAKLTKDTVKV